MSNPFLSAVGLRKSFGQVEVLHGVDLDLVPGTVTALLGENGAGKSTLVRILAGDHQPDGGSISLDGNAERYTVAGARRRGIRLITQEISDAPTLTVAENVVLGDWPTVGPWVNRRSIQSDARDALAALDTTLDLDAIQGTLRLGERQIVEVARAIRGHSKLIIFDEPTAALSDAEAQILYRVIGTLTAKGVAVLYITHRLDEVFAIAHRVVVLRDGVVSLRTPIGDTTPSAVVEAMVGHAVVRTRGQSRSRSEGGAVIEMRDASGDGFHAVSLAAHRGEIIGIYGKVASGVAEVAECLFGIRPVENGEIVLDGVSIRLKGPADAIARGIGYLPPDRARDSAFLILSVAQNLAAPSWRRLAHALTVMTDTIDARAYRRWHESLGVRSTGNPRQALGTLSGGNQQKVLLGRWLEAGSRVLVLGEPTRGVDVGAREEIYALLRQLADAGTTIIVASSDYEDIVGVADNALVMVRGEIVARIPHSSITVSSLTEAAGGAIHV